MLKIYEICALCSGKRNPCGLGIFMHAPNMSVEEKKLLARREQKAANS